MTNATLRGKLDAGNPRRGSLRYRKIAVVLLIAAFAAWAQAEVLWTYNSESNTLTEIVTGDATAWVFKVTADGKVTGMTPGSNLTVDLRQATMPDDAPVIKTWGFATNSSYGYNYLGADAPTIPWTTFYFPEAITSLGYMAVYNWKSIQTIVLPPNLTSIGDYCFERSAGIDLVLPDTVTSIGGSAFNSSASLKTVKMPANLSSCGSSIFNNCGSLREITWPAWCGGWKGTSNAAWSDKNVRYLVPGSNATWMATIADPAFVTYWDDVSASDQAAYYTRYGSDAAKPYGLSVSGKLPGAVAKTWIVVEEAVANRAYIHVTAPSSTFGTLSYSPAPDANGTWDEGTEVTVTFTAAEGVSILGWSGNVPSDVGTESSFTITASGTKALALTCVTESYTYSDGKLSDGSVTLTVTGNAASGFTVKSLDAVGLDGKVDLTKPIVGGGSVIGIAASAFKDNTSVQHVVLPDNLQTIGNNAFYGCTALKSIYPALPKGLRTLGYSSFYNCTALTNGIEIGFGTNAETQAMIPLTINLSHTGDRNASLFSNCYKIPYLKWGPAVTEVPREGARNMSSLTNIEFGINVQYVREFYNSGCGKLATVQCLMTNTVAFTYKGSNVNECFPSTVREIVWNGWYTTKGGSTKLGSWADKDCRFIVPGDNLDWLNFISAYVTPWSSLDETTQQYYYTRYGAEAKEPAGLSAVVPGRHNQTWIVKTDVELSGCMLILPTISDSFGTVTAMPAPRAFDGLYTPNTEVTVSFTPAAGVTFEKWSGDVTDENATNQTFTFSITNSVTLGLKYESNFFNFNNSILTDGKQSFSATKGASGYAVSGATQLSADGVLNLDKADTNGLAITSIGASAFKNSTSITKLILPDGLQSLGSDAFNGCSGIREVVNFLPRGLTWIGNASFASCSAITNVAWIGYGTNESTKAAINVNFDISSSGDRNSNLFGNCSKLPAIHYGPGVVTVPRFAVYGCSKLGEIEMSVNTITNREYYRNGSANITNVVCLTTNTMNFTCNGEGTFNGCGSLRQIVFNGWFNVACGGAFMTVGDKLCRWVVPGDNVTWLNFIGDSTKVQPWSELTDSVKQEYFNRYGEDEDLVPCGLTYAVASKWNRVWVVKTKAEFNGKLLSVALADAAFGTVVCDPQPREDGLYDNDTEVTVTFTPATDVEFRGWSGDVAAEDRMNLSIVVPMTNNMAVTANVLAPFFHYDATTKKITDGVQTYVTTGSREALTVSSWEAMNNGQVDLTKPIQGGGAITVLGFRAFDGSSIREVLLPETLVTMGDRAFDCCYSLTNCCPMVPACVTYFGYSIFANDSGLKGDVEFGYGVNAKGKPQTVSFGLTSSESRSYGGCWRIGPCIRLGPGVVTVPRCLIQNGNTVTNILIEGATAISDYAFQCVANDRNCDVVFTCDKPTMTASAFSTDSNSTKHLRYFTPWNGRDGLYPNWGAFLTNENFVTPWTKISVAERAAYRKAFGGEPRTRHPFGRTLSGNGVLQANRWVFAPVRIGSVMRLR